MKDKRKGKLDKHFTILVNGHKAKILSYRFGVEHGHKHLTLKTLIQNLWLSGRLVGRTCRISIGTEEALQNLRCYCDAIFYDLSLRTYYFYILGEGDIVSHGVVISSEPADCAEIPN